MARSPKAPGGLFQEPNNWEGEVCPGPSPLGSSKHLLPSMSLPKLHWQHFVYCFVHLHPGRQREHSHKALAAEQPKPQTSRVWRAQLAREGWV